MNWCHLIGNVTPKKSLWGQGWRGHEGGTVVYSCPSLMESNPSVQKYTAVFFFFNLGVKSLYFHRLTEHRHGEDQAQDL